MQPRIVQWISVSRNRLINFITSMYNMFTSIEYQAEPNIVHDFASITNVLTDICGSSFNRDSG